MKKILLILLLTLPFIGFGQFTQLNKDIYDYKLYFDSGKIMEEGFSNGVNTTGLIKEYYQNGQLEKIGVYKLPEYSEEDNKKNGRKRWKPSLRIGVWKQYYDNGNLSSTGSYSNGEMVGVWRNFYEDGQMKELLHVVSNKKLKSNAIPLTEQWNGEQVYVNKHKKYHTNGTLKREIDLVKGKMKEYLSNGQLNSEFMINHNGRNGLNKNYNKNGQLVSKGKFINDKREGVWKYYENGELECERNYIDNKIISEKCWDEDGNEIDCQE